MPSAFYGLPQVAEDLGLGWGGGHHRGPWLAVGSFTPIEVQAGTPDDATVLRLSRRMLYIIAIW